MGGSAVPKRLLTAVLVVGWLALIALVLNALGVYASFTDSVRATQTVSSGCLRIEFVQVDGHPAASARAITWTADAKMGEIDVVHQVAVTNVCSLRVSGLTLSARPLSPDPKSAPSVSGGGDLSLTLTAAATGPSGKTGNRTDTLARWQAQPWVIPPTVSAIDPSQSLQLALTLTGKVAPGGEGGGGVDRSNPATPTTPANRSGDDQPPKASSIQVVYTIAAQA